MMRTGSASTARSSFQSLAAPGNQHIKVLLDPALAR
jgi:hypothetical protein